MMETMPRLDSEAYTVDVYKDITSGTYVCSVHAEDQGSHLNQEIACLMVTYSDTKAQEKFDVNSETVLC